MILQAEILQLLMPLLKDWRVIDPIIRSVQVLGDRSL